MRLIRWIAPIACLGLFAVARADDEKIKVEDLPKAVLQAAKKAFPEARIVGASKEKDEGETVFEVEMKLDGKSVALILDDEGQFEAVEKEIDPEDLPRAVLKAARAKFPMASIIKVEEVSDEDDVVVYELTFEAKGEESFEVVMAPNGKVLKAEGVDKVEADKKDKGDDKKARKKDKDEDDGVKKPKG